MKTNKEQLREDFLNAERAYPEYWYRKHGKKKLVALSLTFRRKVPEYNIDREFIRAFPVRLDDAAVDETLRHFTNYLDRELPPGTRRTREKLPKLFVCEYKKDIPHLHGVIALPEHKLISTAMSQIHECWARCDLASNKQNRILTRYEDPMTGDLRRIDHGWIEYISKLKGSQDRVCVEHSFL